MKAPFAFGISTAEPGQPYCPAPLDSRLRGNDVGFVHPPALRSRVPFAKRRGLENLIQEELCPILGGVGEDVVGDKQVNVRAPVHPSGSRLSPG